MTDFAPVSHADTINFLRASGYHRLADDLYRVVNEHIPAAEHYLALLEELQAEQVDA